MKRTGSCAGVGSTSSASSPRSPAATFIRAYVGKLRKKLGFSHISAASSSSLRRADRRGFQKNFPRVALKAHVDGLPET